VQVDAVDRSHAPFELAHEAFDLDAVGKLIHAVYPSLDI
jgi:hypothetical protein